MNSALEKYHVLVMFYGDPDKNKNEYEMFFNMTEKFQHLHFYCFTNTSIFHHLNVSETPPQSSIIIFKTFDEEVNVYSGFFTNEDVHKFIKVFSRPVLSKLNGDSYLYIMNQRISF